MKDLLTRLSQELDAQVCSRRICHATRRTYENNLSRIVEAFVKTHSTEEMLALVRSTTSRSKTNAETQRTYRLLLDLASQMQRGN
jgi:hypothetical protein